MPKRTPPETRQKIVELRKDGKTYSQIQNTLDVSSYVVARTLKEAGMTGNNQPTQASDPDPEPTDEPQPGSVDDLVPDGPTEADETPVKSWEATTPCCGSRIRVNADDPDQFPCPGCGTVIKVAA